MKKLLLGMVIALTTLTATLYAACTADVDMGTKRVTNMGEPNSSTDAATKNYVDTAVLNADGSPLKLKASIDLDDDNSTWEVVAIGHSAICTLSTKNHFLQAALINVSYGSVVNIISSTSYVQKTDGNTTAGLYSLQIANNSGGPAGSFKINRGNSNYGTVRVYCLQ
jgi:hypothetical protein